MFNAREIVKVIYEKAQLPKPLDRLITPPPTSVN